MTDYSLNGWPVLDYDSADLATGVIPGVGRKVTLARAALPLFLSFLADWHAEMGPRMSLLVGPIDGHEVREGRSTPGRYSNHASGTAVDVLYNSVLPADNAKHMTVTELATLDRILSRYTTADGHRVLANGEWWNKADGMHTELSQGWERGAKRNTTSADVREVIKRLGIKSDGTRPGGPTDKPAPTPAPTPVPPVVLKGEGNVRAWLLDPQRGLTPAIARVLWSIAVRESGCDSQMIYPAGAHDPTVPTPPAKPSDWGLWQINSTHLPEIRKRFGSRASMALMLDPTSALAFVRVISKDYTDWLDWGFRIENGTRLVMDWQRYPAEWVAKNGAEAEAGLRAAWRRWTPQVTAPPAPKPTPKPVPKPVPAPVAKFPGRPFGKGAHGAHVKVVQRALGGLEVDGLFGPATLAAVAAFQRKHYPHLGRPDGIVGPKTYAALVALLGR